MATRRAMPLVTGLFLAGLAMGFAADRAQAQCFGFYPAPAYVVPAPVYVAPAPVYYVAPATSYYYYPSYYPNYYPSYRYLHYPVYAPVYYSRPYYVSRGGWGFNFGFSYRH